MLHFSARNWTFSEADLVDVEVSDGFPQLLDDIARRAPVSHHFLRRAWYDSDESEGSTVVARRPNGTLVAAIPTLPLGPSLLGARAVAGSYWPFRSLPVSGCASDRELGAMLADARLHGAIRSLLRIGPVYEGDPAAAPIVEAAHGAGWSVLTRSLGRAFLLDIAGLRARGPWPRKSTRRRIRNYENQLARLGPLRLRHISGAGWNRAAFAALARIEGNSWVAKKTDRSGTKFSTQRQRAYWRRVVRDRALAERLSATLLYVGDTPAAFSFDLRTGSFQYSIASSYDERFARYRPGKIVTYRQLEACASQGVTTVDLGAGDSGYKREMGAEAGPRILDYLLVRNRLAAWLLRPAWERGRSGDCAQP